MRLCACGNPTCGKHIRVYKKKDGSTKEYVYDRYKCYTCINAAKSGKRKKEIRETIEWY